MGVTFLGLTLAFGLWIQVHDLHIIDEVSDPEKIRMIVAAMTPEQRSAHWWMTLVLDYVYPIAYGMFFAGLALRYFGKAGLWLAVPTMICVPADIVENTMQLLILAGDESAIEVKAIATPIKLVTFIVGVVITLAGLGIASYRRITVTGDTQLQ